MTNTTGTASTSFDVAAEPSYGSDRVLYMLASIMNNHRAIGHDFPQARANLLANLRTLQSALPAAIAAVEAAMEEV